MGGGAHLVGKASHTFSSMTSASLIVHTLQGGKLAFSGAGLVAGGAQTVGKGVFHGVSHGVSRVVPGRRSYEAPAGDASLIQSLDMSLDQSLDESGIIPYDVPTQASAATANGHVVDTTALASSGINGRVAIAPINGQPDFGDLQVTILDVQGTPEDGKSYVMSSSGAS